MNYRPANAHSLLERAKQKAALMRELAQKEAGVPAAEVPPRTDLVPSTPVVPSLQATAAAKSTSALELIARLRAAKVAKKSAQEEAGVELVKLQLPEAIARTIAPDGQLSKHQITAADLNEKQKLAVRLAQEGQGLVLIGSAGSGKTTTVRVMAEVLASGGTIGIISKEQETKALAAGSPAITICSFTNQAVTNIKEAVPAEFKQNCTTIHKLLEYSPEYFTAIADDGTSYETMRFSPMRTPIRPIPRLDILVIEEAGSVSLELYDLLMAALPCKPTTIFLGDLNQIPPVFGDAILGYKLLELPVVELTHTYRQETDSPIKKLAYRILEGSPMSDKEVMTFQDPGVLEFAPFKIPKEWEGAVPDCGAFFASLVHEHFRHVKAGTEPENPLTCFDYENDVLLIPYNKQLGTDSLGVYIAQAVSTCLDSPTYEIICGFRKLYYAVGDIVYWDKNKWRITEIKKNPAYIGVSPQPPSTKLSRNGINSDEVEAMQAQHERVLEDMDRLFEMTGTSAMADNETAKRAASHQIVLQDCNEERPAATISGSGDLTSMYLAYALTVHKSQGSEWTKVFCLFHHSHAVLLQREILYTAFTRARKYMKIFYSGEQKLKPGSSVFQRGIINQKIPGNDLKTKLKYFRSKLQAEATKQEIKAATAAQRPVDLAKVLTMPDSDLATSMLRAVTHKNKEEY